MVYRAKVEGAVFRAESLRDLRRQETLKVIANRLADTARLLLGLMEQTVREVGVNGHSQLCPKLCLTELSRVVKEYARLRLSSGESVLRKCLEMGANTSDSDPRFNS